MDMAANYQLNPAANQIDWNELQVITAKIKQKTSVIPQIGIICGSGLGGLADKLDDALADKAIKIPYEEIGLPKCSGKLRVTTIQGCNMHY